MSRFELKVIVEPKSAKLCGGCAGAAHSSDESVICVFFGHTELNYRVRDYRLGYLRLPECIAAEQKAAHDTQAEKGKAQC